MIAVVTIVVVVGLILLVDYVSVNWFVPRRLPAQPLLVIWVVFAVMTVLLFVNFGWNRTFYISLFVEIGLLGFAVRTLDRLLEQMYRK